MSHLLVVLKSMGSMALLRRRTCGLQVVQLLGLVAGQQPDLHQVEGADESVTDAESTRADDGVSQWDGPAVLDEQECGCRVVRDLLQHVPRLLVGEHLQSVLAGGRTRLGARSHPSLALDPDTQECADCGSELDGLLLRQIAEVLDLDLTAGVLVDSQCVDHPYGVALAKPLELGDDLAVEVWVSKPEHDELNRSYGHDVPLRPPFPPPTTGWLDIGCLADPHLVSPSPGGVGDALPVPGSSVRLTRGSAVVEG